MVNVNKEIITSFLEKGILISPEIAEDDFLLLKAAEISPDQLKGVFVIDKAFLKSKGIVSSNTILENKTRDEKSQQKFRILFSYNKDPGAISVQDFVSYFNRRFESIASFLRQRQELQNTTSILRIKTKKERENVSFIGMVYDKSVTKNNNILLSVEDVTGRINVLVSEKKKEIYELAKDLVLDDIIGVEGVAGGSFVLANQIFLPDIPITKELKKSPEEEYIAFMGDPHFGSKVFLKKEFEDFIEWINQSKGSVEQREIASKVKYLIIIGDLVEGLGVYPGQEDDLEIMNIKEQYELFTEQLKRIPSSITIFICPGNHDAGRISEPQPPLLHDYAKSLRSLPNVVLLSNPSLINLGATKDFSGFDLLLYHGYSLIYFADNVPSIRAKGGQKRADLIMKFLLQRRHLAPTHASNLYIPDKNQDPLVINIIPDFFVTGHIHRVSVNNYKNITLLNCSCWTDITEDQEKRGLQPQPGRIILVNLQNREAKIINFFKEEKENEESNEINV